MEISFLNIFNLFCLPFWINWSRNVCWCFFFYEGKFNAALKFWQNNVPFNNLDQPLHWEWAYDVFKCCISEMSDNSCSELPHMPIKSSVACHSCLTHTCTLPPVWQLGSNTITRHSAVAMFGLQPYPHMQSRTTVCSGHGKTRVTPRHHNQSPEPSI